MNLTLHKSRVPVGKWIPMPLIQYCASHRSLPPHTPHRIHTYFQPPGETTVNVGVLNLWVAALFPGTSSDILHIDYLDNDS